MGSFSHGKIILLISLYAFTGAIDGYAAFTCQPNNTTVLAGSTATFSICGTTEQSASLQWYRNGTPIPGATSASYTTGLMFPGDNGALFYCVETTTENSTIQSSPAILTVNENGGIIAEYWFGITGGAIADLTGSPNYPDSPDQSEIRAIFEVPEDWQDAYGTRVRGYIHPPYSGNYYFYISSDGNGELWLSSDESPDNKTKIAYEDFATTSRVWQTGAEMSASIYLESGRKYYIEALMKEGVNGDNLAIGWEAPDNNLLERPIPGDRLSLFVDCNQQNVSITAAGDGAVLGAGPNCAGNEVFVATTNYGECFDHWEGGPIDGSTDPTERFIMPSNDVSIQAVFNSTSCSMTVNGDLKVGGNVGIGVNPQYKLDVNGAVHCSEIVVEAMGGADYVFDSKYNLRDLDELEKYVTDHKRLPGIASESEMIENGIKINELQIKLLEKVEELTLYAIEQNKKIRSLEAKLEIMQTQIPGEIVVEQKRDTNIYPPQ